MKVLALDGALGSFSAAVLAGERGVEGAIDARQALEGGLALLADVLARAGVTLGELDRIAVGNGPGGFTGLRIAVAYAKSLAVGLNLPLVAISSYDALEGEDAATPSLAVVQAKSGTICARLRHGGGEERRCGPTRDVIEALLPLAGDAVVALRGRTEDVFAACGERGLQVRTTPAPDSTPAATIARLGARRPPAGSAHAVRPDYGSLPAANVPRGLG